jgi:hypothetical protein
MDDGKTWVIMRGFGYMHGPPDAQNAIDIPIGFQTDFASVPWIFQWLIPKWGKYGNAAIVHDWLYWNQSSQYPREVSDGVFLEAMGIMRVDVFRKHVIYIAVRLMGRLAWMRNKEDKESGYDRVLRNLEIKAGAKTQRRGEVTQIVRAFTRRIRRHG